MGGGGGVEDVGGGRWEGGEAEGQGRVVRVQLSFKYSQAISSKTGPLFNSKQQQQQIFFFHSEGELRDELP